MHDATGTAAIIARVLDEIRLEPDRLAACLAIPRSTLEAYLADPLSTPYPIRMSLAFILQHTGDSAQQMELGRVLEVDTRTQLDEDAGAFWERLEGAAPDEIERAFNEFLSSALMCYPGRAPVTLVRLAALAGLAADVPDAVIRSEETNDGE